MLCSLSIHNLSNCAPSDVYGDTMAWPILYPGSHWDTRHYEASVVKIALACMATTMG